MKFGPLQFLFLSFLFLSIGCSEPKPIRKGNFQGNHPIKATVTVGMVADLVREIGGEKVSVQQLMQAGIDPHLYKPTRDDVVALIQADIIFYSGLMLEGKMAQTLKHTSNQRRAFAAAESLPHDVLSTEDDGEELHGHPDPHVWMSVELWRQVSKAILEQLIEFDPPSEVYYRENHRILDTKLSLLHEYGRRVISGIPDRQRVLITSHDAFQYFGRAYGIEVQSVQGLSTESEAGLRRINELVDLIVDRKISSVFVESSVPRKSIEALISGAESRGHQVHIAGSLYSDAMGSGGTYEGTYVGMMDHNLTQVARALGTVHDYAQGFTDYLRETKHDAVESSEVGAAVDQISSEAAGPATELLDQQTEQP